VTAGSRSNIAVLKSRVMKPKSKRSHKTAPAQRPATPARPLPKASEPLSDEPNAFPIVGVGASAGGLEAFTQLLKSLPADPGIALIVVQHLDPTHESQLANILARVTPLPVLQVETGQTVQPNHVYVIRPDRNLAILNGTLSLMPRPEAVGPHLPIDFFFRSLADDQKSRAVGVVLSGTGSDGTLGLRAIKAEGGLTFAQDQASSKFGGMPSSAMAAGMADFVLSPEGIAGELERLAHHPYLLRAPTPSLPELPAEADGDLSQILIILRMETGVDLAHYKPTTIRRRIGRRMALHRIPTYAAYLRFLNKNPAELQSLYQDLLIHVTGFFRDPGMFDALQHQVFPQLLQDRTRETPIRIWVPGCSTGEEAYSLGMALLEFLGGDAHRPFIQIFATDIDPAAIEQARRGVYPENIAADVSPERLERFFVPGEHRYQVSKALRELCVFSRQDVTRDPPFSKMDLISCRNVLIYMDSVLQKTVLPTLHFALNPRGFLVLGTSETIGPFAELFRLIDEKHKIYIKKSSVPRAKLGLIKNPAGHPPRARSVAPSASGFDAQKAADRVALAKFAPAGVLVNDNLDVVQFRGHTGLYLEPAPGTASLNLLKMARPGLVPELRAALNRARTSSVAIRKTGVQFKADGGVQGVNLEVIPIKAAPTSNEGYFLVLFEPANAGEPSKTAKGKNRKTKRSRATAPADEKLGQLQQELTMTKAYLESVIEQDERTNDELSAALEEIQSSNEELQSTNEELETAKEELQATNEELTTVNEELQNRNSELDIVNNDLGNLIASTDIPIVILGNDRRIRRITPAAEHVLGLIPADVGRPLGDLNLHIAMRDWETVIQQVMDTLTVREEEVQNREGRWYSLRLRPYQTSDHRIDGVVLVLFDIDQSKRAADQVREARDYAQAIVETVREPLLVLDGELRVQTANRAFYEMFHITPQETEQQLLYRLGDNEWDIPRLRELLEEILPQNSRFENFPVDAEFPRTGRKQLVLNARRIARQDGRAQLILLAMEEAVG
jgi:two-component system CheB/CheR fusion protein